MIKSTVELTLLKFITSYGSDTLIYWLDHFDKIISTKKYPLYRTLEREACRACCISYADMRTFSNTPSTNAKRIISFLSFHHLHLPVSSISKLLGPSDRNINYYIKEAEGWINAPHTNRVFSEAYNQVVEAIKITEL
jgi:hypothetical protein